MKDVCETMQSQFIRFSHPLLVPTVLIELTANDLMTELYYIHLLLAKSEHKTHYGVWQVMDMTAVLSESDKESVAVDEDEDDSAIEIKRDSSYWNTMVEAMDLCKTNDELARILGSLNCRFAFMDVAVRCSNSMIDFTLREMDLMKEYTGSSRFHQLKSLTNSQSLRQRIELLASNVKHLEMFGAINQRMQAQQNVVSIYGVPKPADRLVYQSLKPSYSFSTSSPKMTII